jgi:hypothetical protein
MRRPMKQTRKRGRHSAPKVLRKSVRKPLIKIIQKVISRNLENKTWFNNGTNQGIANTISQNSPTALSLIPEPSKGTEESNNRVGNQITCKRSFIRGFVNVRPYDATTNPKPLPCWVKMFLCSVKAQNNATFSSNTFTVTDFFKTNSSSQGFVGNMSDMCLPVNTEELRIFKTKTVKLGASYNTTTGPTSSLSYFDNSSMSVPFYFDLTKHLGKLQYNDTTTYPSNRNLFLVFQAVCADGSTGSTGYIPAEVHYTQEVQFEDA